MDLFINPATATKSVSEISDNVAELSSSVASFQTTVEDHAITLWDLVTDGNAFTKKANSMLNMIQVAATDAEGADDNATVPAGQGPNGEAPEPPKHNSATTAVPSVAPARSSSPRQPTTRSTRAGTGAQPAPSAPTIAEPTTERTYHELTREPSTGLEADRQRLQDERDRLSAARAAIASRIASFETARQVLQSQLIGDPKAPTSPEPTTDIGDPLRKAEIIEVLITEFGTDIESLTPELESLTGRIEELDAQIDAINVEIANAHPSHGAPASAGIHLSSVDRPGQTAPRPQRGEPLQRRPLLGGPAQESITAPFRAPSEPASDAVEWTPLHRNDPS